MVAHLFKHVGPAASLAKFNSFKSAASFWKNVEELGDTKLAPPVALDKRVTRPGHTCPIFIHGDGVEYATRDSLMTWSWGSLLNKQSSLDSHILLAAFTKSCSVADTWTALNDLISWSFTALLKGKHPSKDPYRKPLVKGMAEKLACHSQQATTDVQSGQ